MDASPPDAYPGGELELFREARNWKAYLAQQLAHVLEGEVLEVGAGIGGMTRGLCHARHSRWLALESDPELAAHIRADAESGRFAGAVEVQVGTLANLAPDARFDALLYADVLEHIENDAEELIGISVLGMAQQVPEISGNQVLKTLEAGAVETRGKLNELIEEKSCLVQP